MIVVDTSVWVRALRDRSSTEASILTQLLDDDEVLLPIPVKVELLSGTSKRDRAALVQSLEALPLAYPSEDTWRTMVQWTEQTGAAGLSFGVGDLLIAGVAREHDALVWSLDSAFERLERLGLIAQYETG